MYMIKQIKICAEYWDMVYLMETLDAHDGGLLVFFSVPYVNRKTQITLSAAAYFLHSGYHCNQRVTAKRFS